MAHDRFDHIIIGAGSAGCVLASRLTEDPGVRVLLVEAGGKDASLLVRMPAGVGALIGKAKNFCLAFHRMQFWCLYVFAGPRS